VSWGQWGKVQVVAQRKSKRGVWRGRRKTEHRSSRRGSVIQRPKIAWAQDGILRRGGGDKTVRGGFN